jgi:hypothetical protein
MIEDMAIRKFGQKTQHDHVRSVKDGKRAENIARARELLALPLRQLRPSRPPAPMPTNRKHQSMLARAAAAL